jgi:hypothetical protein
MIRSGFGHGEERPQVDRERSAAVAMLSLPTFVVLAVSEHDGELEQGNEHQSGNDTIISTPAGRVPPRDRRGVCVSGWARVTGRGTILRMTTTARAWPTSSAFLRATSWC